MADCEDQSFFFWTHWITITTASAAALTVNEGTCLELTWTAIIIGTERERRGHTRKEGPCGNVFLSESKMPCDTL